MELRAEARVEQRDGWWWVRVVIYARGHKQAIHRERAFRDEREARAKLREIEATLQHDRKPHRRSER